SARPQVGPRVLRVQLDRLRRRLRPSLVPEHDLSVANLEDRSRFGPRPVALVAGPLSQQGRGGDPGAGPPERDDPARARQPLVPVEGVLVRAQQEDAVALYGTRSRGEQVGRLAVVTRVHCLQPGAYDRLGRGATPAAAPGEEGGGREGQ